MLGPCCPPYRHTGPLIFAALRVDVISQYLILILTALEHSGYNLLIFAAMRVDVISQYLILILTAFRTLWL